MTKKGRKDDAAKKDWLNEPSEKYVGKANKKVHVPSELGLLHCQLVLYVKGNTNLVGATAIINQMISSTHYMPKVLDEVVVVMLCGAKKYGIGNFLLVDDWKRRYCNALLRHVLAMPSVDKDFGASHAAHALANLFILRQFEENTLGPALEGIK